MLVRLLARASGLIAPAVVLLSVHSAVAADKVTLRLDYVNTGFHAIWYYGIDQGIFKENGIDLDVLQGQGSASTAQTVGNGSVMFGTADTATVMGFVSQGMPIKIVGGYMRESPLAIIFPADKGWKSFSDLSGKIGFSAGGATADILPALLKAAGAENKVELINMDPATKLTALLTGRVDGVDSFGFLVVAILEAKGMKVSTLPYAKAGINVPGLSLIANDAVIEKQPDIVRRMVKALDESIASSRKNPEAAIDAIMKRTSSMERAVALRTLLLSFDLLDPDWAKGKPASWMSPEIIAKSQDILFEHGIVKQKLPIDRYFTNKYAPAG
jgi:NitT/TauT family transport system substrate-binding protein